MHLHADEATIVSLTFIGRIAMGPADASRGPFVYSSMSTVGSAAMTSIMAPLPS